MSLVHPPICRIILTVLYFDQETNACLEGMRNCKFLEYNMTVWMGGWVLAYCTMGVVQPSLANLSTRISPTTYKE